MKRNLVTCALIAACCCGVLAGAAVGTGETAILWLGANLPVNAGFEEGGAAAVAKLGTSSIPGWTFHIQGSGTVQTVASGSLEGKQAMKLDLPSSASGIVVSSEPISVEPGTSYLFSIAFRQMGFNRLPGYQNKYEGVNSYAQIQWLDKDHRPTGEGQVLCPFPYRPSPWDMRDIFACAPSQAKFAVISIHIGNHSEKEAGKNIPSALWVGAVQFRMHLPPPTPDWAKRQTPRIVEGGQEKTPGRVYFVASSPEFRNARGGAWSRIVIDPKAERGAALEAPPCVGQGVMALSPYYPAMPSGLYRLRVRVKVADNTRTDRAGYIDVDSGSSGQRLLMDIVPANFPTANEYVDMEKDFILRDNGWWDIRLQTLGNTAWTVDSVKVIPLRALEDRQLLAVFPAMAGDISPTLRPRRMDPCRVLMVAGFGYDMFEVAPSLRMLARDVEIKPAWMKSGLSGSAILIDFPETQEELFDFNLIVMGNVPASALSLLQKSFVREYLRRGGAMLALGGMMAFERGGWRGSLLEEALPVEVGASSEENTLFNPKGMRLGMADESPAWVREMEFEAPPYAYFLHKVSVKTQAQLFVSAGGRPFLTGGDYGEGRSVCVLGMPYGTGTPGQIPFWKWTDWNYLLRNAMWWTMRRN